MEHSKKIHVDLNLAPWTARPSQSVSGHPAAWEHRDIEGAMEGHSIQFKLANHRPVLSDWARTLPMSLPRYLCRVSSYILDALPPHGSMCCASPQYLQMQNGSTSKPRIVGKDYWPALGI